MLAEEVIGKRRGFETPSDLEKEFIGYLSALGYEYLDVRSEDDILLNLREQIQRLNTDKGIVFTDSEWRRFFDECICKAGEETLDKIKKIQVEGFKHSLVRDDGTTENIRLIDRRHFYNNKLQFINRYSNTETQGNVTILLNGLPMVHVEIGRTAKDIQSIFADARPYRRSNFMGSSGLFDFCEIFIISNGSETKYYSSTTRHNFIKDYYSRTVDIASATSNSFMFTSYWSDEKNLALKDLSDFSKTFLEQKNLLEVIINFSVLDTNGVLKIMRPYQIYATKKIINRIKSATKDGILGNRESGGYIWHATGSGKTLTSFKASRLATKIPEVDKVLFVVDRKDLDHQTQREYGTFEEGSAQGIKSVDSLRTALSTQHQRIIITTIQKLHGYIEKYKNQDQDIFKQHTVLIFDECHRSQFGAMHNNIRTFFRNSHIFGFTGTPIFEDKEQEGTHTTEKYFGEELHKYTLLDAIRDKNVLQFKVDYLDFVEDLSRENPTRIREVVKYIIERFDNKTLRPPSSISLEEKRNRGYNSILCVDSIDIARKYYSEFKRQLSPESDRHKKLVVSTIYSSQETKENLDLENSTNPDIDGMDAGDLDFLEGVIKDYNEIFNTSYSTRASSFNSYYQDLSKRTRDKEIDILIVVNMFLTGFDAPSLNTLWVDKKLEQHGLIQAFSRTNRIYKNTKTFGNVVCFRNIEKSVDEAFANYGGGNPTEIIYPCFEEKYGEYKELAEKLMSYQDKDGNVVIEPVTEENECEYANCFADLIKLKNELNAYDEFAGKEIIDPESWQKFQSKYIDLKEKYSSKKSEDGGELDHDFAKGLEFIKSVEITLEYIIDLIITHTKWKNMDSPEKIKSFKEKINNMIDSATYLRSKKEVINSFIDDVKDKTDESFKEFIEQKLGGDIKSLAEKERIDFDATIEFIARAFRNNKFEKEGKEIEDVVPPSRLNREASLSKQDRVFEELENIYEKYHGLIKFEVDKWIP